MSKDEKQICLYCKWWKTHTFARTNGNCYYSPPVVLQMGSSETGYRAETFHPDARASNFCSKFEDRPDDHVSDTWQSIGDAASAVVDKIELGTKGN